MVDFVSILDRLHVLETRTGTEVHAVERFIGRFETGDRDLPRYESITSRICVFTFEQESEEREVRYVDVDFLDFDGSETSRDSTIEGPPHPLVSPEATVPRPSSNWTWSGTASGAYADKDAINHNTSVYRDYTNDCTNFASQCLKDGGKTERGGVFELKEDKVWVYGSLEATTSYTLAGAQNLFRHLRDHTNSAIVGAQSNLRVGDLVFIEPAPGGSWHAMIVGAKTNTDLLMNYHTNDTYRRSLNEIKRTSPTGSKFHHVTIGTSYTTALAPRTLPSTDGPAEVLRRSN